MKVPARNTDITKDWVLFMLNEYENRINIGAKLTIKSLDISKATKPGDGYTGDLIKIDTTAAVHYDGENNSKDKGYNLIVKFANPDPVISVMQTFMSVNIRELTVYSDVITEFNKFQAEQTNNEFPIRIPEYIYGECIDDQFVLVMQNLKSCDFDTNCKLEPMNVHQTKMVLEQHARLHAVSYAYDKKYGFLKKFPFYKTDNIKTILNMGCNVLYDELLIEYIGTLSGRETLLKKVKEAKSTVLKNAYDAFEEGSHLNIKCLLHGDSWNNNIMFKQKIDEEGKASVKNSDDIALIDWQFTHWNTSVADLYYFLFSSTTAELRKDHLEELLQYYHSMFIDVTTKLGSPVPFWTYKQFKNEYNRLAAYGFLRGIIFTGILSDAAQDMKLAPDGSGDDYFIIKKMKTCLSKLIAPILMKHFALEAYTKKMIQPTKEELLSGKTPRTNHRVLSLILEAEENGLFDI
ncbi:unnamed protein product [Meganyctiphanes norvegica]|uniref:CHK kinase-like domain-containing protein n=1 Tax=Meganyctiphanes norvegica TaxID=48144 RepID=A0AAV2RSM7_MEGNR